MAVIQYTNGQDRTDPIVLTDDTTQLEVLAAETATQSGVISETGGSWGIEKIGGGTLTLTGDNTYTGPTVISGGTLALDYPFLITESDFSIAAGATLKLADDMSFADIGALSGAGDVDLGLDSVLTSYNDVGEDTTFSGSIFDQSGTDPDHWAYFIACGGGLLTLTGDSEFGGFFEVDYDGFVNIDGGSVTSDNTDQSQTIISGTLRILNGGTLNTTWIQNAGGTLVVDGEGSTATASDWTSVNGVLSVGNGGVVTSQEDARIGNWVDFPATATVSGAGSKWNITGLLEIGTDDLSDPFFSQAGILTITAGGEVTADEITIASVGSLYLGEGGLAGALNAGTIANEGAIGANFTDAATLDAIISGTGTLTKDGSGTLILSGDNTFSGGTTISGGTISLAHDNALGAGALTTTGSVVDYVDGVDIGNALVLEGDDTQLQVLTGAATQSGVISELGGPYGLEKIGDGTLVVSGINIYTGDTIITAGALRVTNDGAVGTGQVVLNGGAFQAGAADLSFANAFNVNTAGGMIDTNGFDLTISGGIGDGNGADGALTKAGLGTLTLEGLSSYTGSTTIAAGTLLSTTNSALANFSAFTVDESGTLQIADAVFNHIGSLAGAGAVDIGLASTLRVGLDNTSTIFDGDINGAGSFSKTGTGTLTLTGTSDIAGNLTITPNFGTGALVISGGSFDAGGVQHDAGKLSVINGGTLHSDGELRIRGDLTIDGIGSTVTAAGETEIIAFANPLEATISDQGILNSEAGATIDSIIGQAVSVTVTGEGSAWNVKDSLAVGVDFGATLNVTDGGLVTAGDVSLNSLSTLNLGSGGLAGEIDTPTIANDGAIVANFTDTLTLAADISGDGSLTKAGSGTLTLSGNNSYTGGTTLAGGTLRLEDGNALGTGALTTLGSVVDYGEGIVVSNPIILDSEDTQLQVLIGIAEQEGDISETGGARPLEKIGNGILVLSGDNTYTGATTVSAGTLIGASDFALSQFSAFTVNAGATLVVDDGVDALIGSLAGAGTVVVEELAFLSVGSDDTSTTFSGSITGDGDFEKTGSGTMTLTGTSSIAGELSLCGCSDSNVLEISGGSFTADFDTVVFGGTLAVTNGGALTTDFLAVDGNVEISGPGSLVTAASGAQIGLGLALTPASLTISNGGILNTGADAGLFSLPGAATATVTGVGSAWNIAGDLFIGDDMGLDAEGDLTIADGGTVTAGHVFVGAGSNLVFGDGSLAGSLIAPTIANEGDIIANFTDTLTLAAAISGAGQFFKAGSGKLILTGTSTYTGATTVSGGTLQVDGSIVSAATVNGGGALGGNGTTAAVAVDAGGTLAPGASAGILSTGNVMLAAGAAFAVELGGAAAGVGGYDQLDVTGTVQLGGATLAASLIAGFDPGTGAIFTVIDNDGVDAVVGTFTGLAQGATLDFGGRSFTISYAGGDGNDVTLTALEPPPPPPPGVTIVGNSKNNVVDATHTVKDQPLPTEGNDHISGRGGNDRLSGLGGDDVILGGKGKDVLHGNEGNDWLSGGLGKNKLTGGEGDDSFVFDTKLGKGKDGGAKNASYGKITDFAVGDDGIELSKAIFKKLDLGMLSDDVFRDVGEAKSEGQLIVYKANGDLIYDKHGGGSKDGIAFAKLTTKPDIDASDFLVVG